MLSHICMVRPINKYLEAKELLDAGNRTGAAQALAEAMGAHEPTPAIEANLDRLLDRSSMANEVAQGLVAAEVRRR